jgi:ankyrin repeat protein
MLNIPNDDPRAAAVVSAIHSGDVEKLQRLLEGNPDLATSRIIDAKGAGRTLLHIAADWPGHFPNGARTVAALVAAGADVNAPMIGPHRETPLHWAASSDDVAVLDALLDGGADIESPGAVFTGGAPMSDAVVFAQWNAARRLLARGARTTIWQAAALGLLDRVRQYCAAEPSPSPDQVTNAFWHACRGGQRQAAEYLLARGANLNWIGYSKRTPLDAAEHSDNDDLIAWLKSQGARSGTASGSDRVDHSSGSSSDPAAPES